MTSYGGSAADTPVPTAYGHEEVTTLSAEVYNNRGRQLCYIRHADGVALVAIGKRPPYRHLLGRCGDSYICIDGL